MSAGRYYLTKKSDVPPEQRAVLCLTTRAHLHERLCALVAEGKVAASVVASGYHSLMQEAGVSQNDELEEKDHEEVT